MFEFLEGFEKRMEFVAVVESIVDRKNTSKEIEDWFEENELDNLLFSLLVYIMEQTLSENDDCTMENMTVFIDKILPMYNKTFSFDKVKKLTEYMIKYILQNKGTIKYYNTMQYPGSMKSIKVRLISDKILEDNRIIYQLTDQGYNFLFRTKEVDRELDFKLEQLKLKELLKRKNYKHAVGQSKELVSMLRQKKRELEEFIYRIRQNIHEIDKGEYEKILKETYSLIDEEYEIMMDIKLSVEQDELRINKEREENGYMDDAMFKALGSLFEIRTNIQTVIGEQGNLMAKRFSMNDIYEETIKNSFHTSMVKRYDFEKEVLEPLTKINEKTIPYLWRLLMPLSFPVIRKSLNLKLLYEPQGKLKEMMQEELQVEDEELLETMALEEIKKKNEINLSIMGRVFKYAADRGETFTFGELYHYIETKAKRLMDYTQDKRIFLIMLKLYEIREIDIEGWQKRESKDTVPEANGEFDLAWCLFELEQTRAAFYGVKKLKFKKQEGQKLKFEIEDDKSDSDNGLKTIIEMDDFMIVPCMTDMESAD
jgi:hypothetical protein